MNNAPEPLTPMEIHRALRSLAAGDVPSPDVLQRALLMALMAPVLNDLNARQQLRIAQLQETLGYVLTAVQPKTPEDRALLARIQQAVDQAG